MPTRRPVARVLFDESHGEAWTIRPEIARAISPAHPEDSSYVLAAQALGKRDIAVTAHVAGPLDAAALGEADVLVLAHPSDSRWERTVPGGAGPVLADDELDAIEAFVRAGGGLLVLGEEEHDKYANNLNALVARFGITIENDAVSDYEQHDDAPHWVLAELDHESADGVDVLAGVRQRLLLPRGPPHAVQRRAAAGAQRAVGLLPAGGAAGGRADRRGARRRGRRLRPVRRRLPGAARPRGAVEQPRPLAGRRRVRAAGAGAALAGAAGPELGAAA